MIGYHMNILMLKYSPLVGVTHFRGYLIVYSLPQLFSKFFVPWYLGFEVGNICQHLVPLEFRMQEVYLISVRTWCICGFGSGSPIILKLDDRDTCIGASSGTLG